MTPTTIDDLNEQGLKDGLLESETLAVTVGSRLLQAEAKLAAAEVDVTALRKLAALLREMAATYRHRLNAVQAAAQDAVPDG